MKNDNYFIDDRPIDLSIYSDEEIEFMIGEMEERHKKIKQEIEESES